MINRAIQFATACHVNQTRKGTDIPYILHCLEAGTIAANLTNENGRVDSDVVSASILHDTIEDAYVSYETLKEVFNENIANLVRSQSEDKSKKWMDRKQNTLNRLKTNKSKYIEIATLADKLSNMRSIFKDYEIEKEKLWEKFNAGRELQHWYYKSIAESLYQVRGTKEYREYKDLIKKVFEIR
ncbi:HD domain-containing protein [Oceanobacillus sp. HCA-5259]|uniref:HD domain-containing protein n=1 Tax=Oceanobacillus sp. HCA-5259 TaxID=3134661 RepID=UPI0030C43723